MAKLHWRRTKRCKKRKISFSPSTYQSALKKNRWIGFYSTENTSIRWRVEFNKKSLPAHHRRNEKEFLKKKILEIVQKIQKAILKYYKGVDTRIGISAVTTCNPPEMLNLRCWFSISFLRWSIVICTLAFNQLLPTNVSKITRKLQRHRVKFLATKHKMNTNNLIHFAFPSASDCGTWDQFLVHASGITFQWKITWLEAIYSVLQPPSSWQSIAQVSGTLVFIFASGWKKYYHRNETLVFFLPSASAFCVFRTKKPENIRKFILYHLSTTANEATMTTRRDVLQLLRQTARVDRRTTRKANGQARRGWWRWSMTSITIRVEFDRLIDRQAEKNQENAMAMWNSCWRPKGPHSKIE